MTLNPVTPRTEPLEHLKIEQLPEAIVGPIRATNERIHAKFEQAPSPDVVLILERSATLPAQSAIKWIRERSGRSPLIASLPIGKTLPYMWADYKETENPDFDETCVNLRNAQQYAEFVTWLKTTDDPTIRRLLQQLQRLQLDQTRLLVLDDARASGETQDLTLPALIEAVHGRKLPFEFETFFSGSLSWEKLAIDQSGVAFPPAESALMNTIMKGSMDLRRFKIEWDSGFYHGVSPSERAQISNIIKHQYRRGEALLRFAELNTSAARIALEMAGMQALMETQALTKTTSTRNPASSLLERFGLQELLGLNQELKTQFERI